MNMTTDRRSFLFGASVAGFGVLVQGKRSLARGVGPNETLNIACIGVGGKGESDTRHAARVGRVVAVCDIDQERLDKMAALQKESKKYNSYRELLARDGLEDRCGDRLDARSHARAGRGDGDEDGQARLLPEAAGPFGVGGAVDAGNGARKERLHPDGQPGHRRFRLPRAVELVRPGGWAK